MANLSLSQILETAEVGEPREAGGLQVFGLRCPLENGLTYTTLDEALAAGTLEVSEVTEGGSVPVLQVANKGATMTLLLAGEQLVGAKQNRVLNTSIMVAGQSAIPIPVSCVEAGRWSYRTRKFGSSGTTSHSHLRRMMAKQVHDSYKATATPSSDQGSVWQEVNRKLETMGSHSDSRALQQAYEDRRDRLNEVLERLPAPEGCCGALFAFGGRVVGVDCFDKSETLAKLWGKLIPSYAIDALEEPETPEVGLTREAARDWLRAAALLPAQPFPSPGVGEDVRLQGEGMVGAGLVVEDHPVHVEVFAEYPPPAGSSKQVAG